MTAQSKMKGKRKGRGEGHGDCSSNGSVKKEILVKGTGPLENIGK